MNERIKKGESKERDIFHTVLDGFKWFLPVGRNEQQMRQVQNVAKYSSHQDWLIDFSIASITDVLISAELDRKKGTTSNAACYWSVST